MKEFLRRVYKKNGNIVFRKIADEFILVPIVHDIGDLNNIYTLNEVGALVWELIDGIRSIKDIKDAILEEYEVTPEQVDTDIKGFIYDLEGIGGIR
jgi:hypothetical protein